MAALIEGDNAQARPERLQHGAIGQGVEAVGVEKHDVGRSVRWTPGQGVKRAAPTGQVDPQALHAAVAAAGD